MDEILHWHRPTDACRCESYNGLQRLCILTDIASQHAAAIHKAQDARRMALRFIDGVGKLDWACILADVPKPPLVHVLDVLAWWLEAHIRFTHSEPGTSSGPVPPATGLPACSMTAGAIWWGWGYTSPRLRSGGKGRYKS